MLKTSIFSSQKPAKPATVPTDTIVPLHFFDDTPIFRGIIMNFTMRFDDVLDPEKLRWSLTRLLERGDWRKLGARLREDATGRLEYHVPASFDKERPAVAFSNIKHSMSIEDHELACRLPRSTGRPALHDDPVIFRPLARRPDGPANIDDYLYRDEPQLSLHVVSFEDATLVSLSWPHTFLDAMGRNALFRAWSQVLNSEESQVPPLNGFDQDPLAPFGDRAPNRPHILANRVLKGLSFILFVFLYVFELLWYKKSEAHVISLPNFDVQAMKQAALKELAAEGYGKEDLFLSDGDVISAWVSGLAVKQIASPTSTKSIVIGNAYGLREMLGKDLLPKNTAYVANAVGMVYAIVPAFKYFNNSVGQVALAVRRSIQEQGTRDEMEGFYTMMRAAMKKGGQVVIGDWRSKLMVISNWTKAKLFETDFSAAVVKEGIPLQRRNTPLGRPSGLIAAGFMNGYSGRYAAPIYGKDADGTHWMSIELRTSSWWGVRETIAKMR